MGWARKEGDRAGVGKHTIQAMAAPYVRSFTIVAPAWLEDSGAEATEELAKQIICHIRRSGDGQDKLYTTSLEKPVTPDGQYDDFYDEIVRQIGTVSAFHELAVKFNNCGDSFYSHTFKTNVSLRLTDKLDYSHPECQCYILWDIVMPTVILANGKEEHVDRGLAVPEYFRELLQEAVQLFQFHHGPVSDFVKVSGQKERNATMEIFTEWWRTWIENKFELASSFAMTGDGVLKLVPGMPMAADVGQYQHHYDVVFKPIIADTSNGVQDVIVINTNWTPVHNWGVLYPTTSTQRYTTSNMVSFVRLLKQLDLHLGLSTYALTYGNWPSLIQYAANLKEYGSLSPEGEIEERSLMVLAQYLSEKRGHEDVYNPFAGVMESISKYTVDPFTGAVKDATDAVVKASFYPWDKLKNYWDATEPQTAQMQVQTNDGGITLLNEDVEEGSGVGIGIADDEEADPLKFENGTLVRECIEMSPKHGKFILGMTHNGIKLHDFHFEQSSGGYEKVKPVMYEINGILFIYMYAHDYEPLTTPHFYTTLSQQFDTRYKEIFAHHIIEKLVHFEKGILSEINSAPAALQQQRQHQHEFNDDVFPCRSAFYIVSRADPPRYWNSIPYIVPTQEAFDLMLPQVRRNYHFMQENCAGHGFPNLSEVNQQFQKLVSQAKQPAGNLMGREVRSLGNGSRPRMEYKRGGRDGDWEVVLDAFNYDSGSPDNYFDEDPPAVVEWRTRGT